MTQGFGVRPRDVFVGELLHDPAEILFEVERVEGDVELVRDRLGVDRVEGATAGLGAALLVLEVGPGAHEEADHVVPLLLEQIRRHRTIDPAAHRQDHPASHSIHPFSDIGDTQLVDSVAENE